MRHARPGPDMNTPTLESSKMTSKFWMTAFGGDAALEIQHGLGESLLWSSGRKDCLHGDKNVYMDRYPDR